MNEFLPPWPLLSAFLLTSLVLALAPGPAVVYIVTRSLAQGRRFGLASVAGLALGNLGNVLAASIGLVALFAISSLAFAVVKYAGALYLIYLGVQVLLAPTGEVLPSVHAPTPVGRVFRDGLVVALLNPKTTIFFVAFLPQFVSTEASPMVQSILLGTLYAAIAAVTGSIYAFAAGAIAPMIGRARGVRALGRYFTAGAFIGLGVFAAVAGSRSGK